MFPRVLRKSADSCGCLLHDGDGCVHDGAATWKGTDVGDGIHHLRAHRPELPSGIGGLEGVLEGRQRSWSPATGTCRLRRARLADNPGRVSAARSCTTSLRTKILDFRGFDSSIILKLRGGILMSTGNIPEIVSQQIFVGIILVGRLVVRQL